MSVKRGVTRDEISAAGRALYGERWQAPLARDLHVSDRTMRRWLAGQFAIPCGVETELRAVLGERLNQLGGIISPAADRGDERTRVDALHGFLRGSVVIPPDLDLTQPVADEAFAAADGAVRR